MVDKEQQFENLRLNKDKTVRIGWFFIQLKLLMLFLESVSLLLLILQLILNFFSDLSLRITLTAIVVLVIAAQSIAIFVIIRKKKDFKVLNSRKINIKKHTSGEEFSQENLSLISRMNEVILWTFLSNFIM